LFKDRLTGAFQLLAKKIYLTFDDGPIPGLTEYVLDQLQSYDAKATFFCVGDNIRKYPQIFRKVIDGGHRVGNHTFNHWRAWQHSEKSTWKMYRNAREL
jgi:peptidoglycan/xylan/chitin deacetylase (PgdA/CDA1 family)